jgi:hypothetical protein
LQHTSWYGRPIVLCEERERRFMLSGGREEARHF